MISILDNIDEFSKLIWVNMANAQAIRLNNLNVDEFLRRTCYLNFNQAADIFNLVEKTNRSLFYGKGLELGAGAGLFSSVISTYPKVSEVWALECIENFVKLLQPRTINKYVDKEKITSVLGSFDNLSYFESNYFDFIFQYDAFHHSNDLNKVLNQCNRVLKKDGKIISIDRVQPNRISDAMKKRKLNIEYTQDYFDKHLKSFVQGYKRQDNGEHEIREKEWIAAFHINKFKNIKIIKYIQYNLKSFVKLGISYLPDWILKRTRFRYLVGEFFFLYIIGFFRKNIPSNQGKIINMKNLKIHKNLSVLICSK